MRNWDELPADMQVDEVKKYYNILQKHKMGFAIKRIFDIVMSSSMLIVLSPVFLVLSILIKRDSSGPVMFRQVRVTTYGKRFQIYKFRTMVNNAEKLGTQVTTKGDARVTKMGKLLRDCRLDELPQLLNILKGDMTFVGTRPEVVKYVERYTNEMKATLLMPAGVTSEASIEYKDEAKLLENAVDVDDVYINQILPEKMKYNLRAIEHFSIWNDLKIMVRTVIAVIR